MTAAWKCNLSQDELIQILVRLPVKSIIHFRCISRLWNTLLSSAYFESLQLSRAKEKPPKLLFFSPSRCTIAMSTSIASEGSFNKVLPLDSPHPTNKLCVVGSCNGLLCLSDFKAFICIWNPATNKHIDVPYPGVRGSTRGIFGMPEVMWLGYDLHSKQYKLVVLEAIFKPKYIQVEEIMVYTLRTRSSWRRIEHAPFRLYFRGNYAPQGALVNGVIHWMCDGNKGSGLKITSFSLKNEKFGEIPLPELKHHEFQSSTMWVLQGCLTTVFKYRNLIDIWQMKDYGRKKSWTKLFSIRRFGISGYVPHQLQPLFFKENGDLVCQDDGRLFLYDPVSRRASFPRFHGIPPFFTTNVYMETLASLTSSLDANSLKMHPCSTQKMT